MFPPDTLLGNDRGDLQLVLVKSADGDTHIIVSVDLKLANFKSVDGKRPASISVYVSCVCVCERGVWGRGVMLPLPSSSLTLTCPISFKYLCTVEHTAGSFQ